MGRVIYSFSVSLDGFVNSPQHTLDWALIDEEIHAWFNDRAREAAAFVYGRRLYETMASYWPHAENDWTATPQMREFARIWNPMPKLVFSHTLEQVDWNSRLLRTDPAEEVEQLKDKVDGDLDIGGPTLAAALIRRNLIDEYRLVVHPVILGGGTPFFPQLDAPIPLELSETRTFGSGAVLLTYSR
jgi:dihydrofolate reductase